MAFAMKADAARAGNECSPRRILMRSMMSTCATRDEHLQAHLTLLSAHNDLHAQRATGKAQAADEALENTCASNKVISWNECALCSLSGGGRGECS